MLIVQIPPDRFVSGVAAAWIWLRVLLLLEVVIPFPGGKAGAG